LNSINAIIVDDEALARLNLIEAIKDHPHWKLVAELSNANRLLETIDAHNADVLFLDIDMPGESGVDAAKKLTKLTTKIPHIVFVTAFDDYAIQAFEFYALDYILKPFDTERFKQCVARVDMLVANQQTFPPNYEHFLNNKYLKKIIIKSTASIRVIDVENIFWLGTNGNYVEVHHTEGCHLHRGSLSNLIDFLDPKVFCRVHRQVVIRIDLARELKSTSDNKNRLVLANGDSVNVSDHYKAELLKFWAS